MKAGPQGWFSWRTLDLPARSRSRLREAPASAGVGRSAKAGPNLLQSNSGDPMAVNSYASRHGRLPNLRCLAFQSSGKRALLKGPRTMKSNFFTPTEKRIAGCGVRSSASSSLQVMRESGNGLLIVPDAASDRIPWRWKDPLFNKQTDEPCAVGWGAGRAGRVEIQNVE